MRQLGSLSIDTPRLPLAVVHAVAELSVLADLSLTFEEIAPAAPAALLALRRLSQLTCLTVRSHWHAMPVEQDGIAVLVPPPACFPHLNKYDMHCCQVSGTWAWQPAGSVGGSLVQLVAARQPVRHECARAQCNPGCRWRGWRQCSPCSVAPPSPRTTDPTT